MLASLLLFLASAAFSQSCDVSSEYHLISPGSSLEMNVSYSNFPFPSPIVVICRSGSPRFCFAGAGSGSCSVTCDYLYKGVYTVPGTSLFSQCSSSLVVVDPDVKPICTLSPASARGNGTLSVRFTAVFANLLPNATTARVDCGNGAGSATVPLVGRKAQMLCAYGAKVNKEVFSPVASAGGASCRAQASVIPTSDSVPPNVSFYNLTNRFSVASVLNISVNASDNVEIDRVELFINYTLVSTMRDYPYYYMFNVSDYSNGTMFPIQAIAYDIYSNSNATPVYYVYKAVSGDRSCNLTANPFYGYIPAVIPLTVVFNNTPSDVLWASFKKDWPAGTVDFSEPYVPITDSVARSNLTYTDVGTFTAYATDGNISCSKRVFISAVPDTTAPSVALLEPKDGDQISIGDSVQLAARARDDIVVRNVEFYLGKELIANVSTDDPDSLLILNTSWNTSSEQIGIYDLTAIAYDGAGNPTLFPARESIVLYTNNSCRISPANPIIQEKKPFAFSVECFNFTYTNVTRFITSVSTSTAEENFTITGQEAYELMFVPSPCNPMAWSSSLGFSDISPTTSAEEVTFTPQGLGATDELSGAVSARDPSTGFSCSTSLIVVKDIPKCAVSVSSPILIGSHVPISIIYENMTGAQDFRIMCRPNAQTTCNASAGSGVCTAVCDYPILGKYVVTAGSSLVACSPKKIAVLLAPDTLPPAVAVTKPFNRQIVNGMARIEAYATDNEGVAEIDLSLDSAQIYSCDSSPCRLSLNTSAYRNGVHTLAAIAYDDSGNWQEYTITVTIAN